MVFIQAFALSGLTITSRINTTLVKMNFSYKRANSAIRYISISSINVYIFQGRNRLFDDFTDKYIERWFTPGNLKTNDLRPKIVSRVISYEIDNLNRYAYLTYGSKT